MFDRLSLAEAPFDRIFLLAQALAMPERLLKQLAPGGVMVAPVDGLMLRVHRDPDGSRVSEHGQYRFVPLIPGDPAG